MAVKIFSFRNKTSNFNIDPDAGQYTNEYK